AWPGGVWMLRLSKIEVSDESAAEIYKKQSAE
ncbi:MAG: hypothetical protein JWO82_3203, partial [Akkermansiaceae bacterium]|nr:hypothetical protein [Akkermansiaceae bacterium]